MRLLLDSHALLWFLNNDSKLSPRAKLLIESPVNVCFVSVASAWEMTIKHSLAKLTLPLPVSQLFPGEIHRQGFDFMAIDPTHLHELDRLPYHHRDPFDRMIIAQAIAEGISLLSADRQFDAYGVSRIW